METRLTVPAEAAGQRLDRYLAESVEGMTRSAADRLLEEGRVTLDGRAAGKNHRLRGGEALAVDVPDPEGGEDAEEMA